MKPVPNDRAAFDALCSQCGVTLPWEASFAPLAAPIALGGKTAPNRVVYQAMEGCDGTTAGHPSEETMRRYRRFAAGGPGIIWFEATAVLPEARANPRQLYLNDDTADAFARACEEIKSLCLKENGYEPLVVIQLTHSGRYSKPNGSPEPLIAGNKPVYEKDRPIDPTRIVSDDYLDRVGEKLVAAAKQAAGLGFDGADIKSCHGYLLSELLAAHTRPGRYGGSFENRTRLLRESVAGARAACDRSFLLTSRMNAYDGFPYPWGFGVTPESGLTPDWTEATRLAGLLREAGLDFLNITMGNPYVNPHVNRPFARGGYEPEEAAICGVERMLKGTAVIAAANPDLPVICSGLSYLGAASPAVASACVADGWFAMAGWGRETLAYPDLARDVCAGTWQTGRQCIACGKCSEIMRAGGQPGCVVRDGEKFLPLYRQYVQK